MTHRENFSKWRVTGFEASMSKKGADVSESGVRRGETTVVKCTVVKIGDEMRE